jgi:ABC-type anion transport system duplicated permease subunit
MSELSRKILKEAPRLGAVLLVEAVLFAIPFIINATENAWHWVDDEGPSFLVYLALGYGAVALLVIVPIVYILSLFMRLSRKPGTPSHT